MKILTLDQPVKTKYCIDLWQRDEQIRRALRRPDVGRLQAVDETRDGPIAVVCFGPSLNDTWEQLRGYRFIISCSGAHKFLVKRGIIPTWHLEVDPRPHKVDLMGSPHPDVEYLIASACHPALFDHLAGHRVRLWHIFDNDVEARRVLPAGEWAVTGGCSVGLRALTMAHFLDFNDLHVFGMDGSYGASGSHALPHPKWKDAKHQVECPEGSGIVYTTSPVLLEIARQTWHELDQMSKVTATFFGEGLVQAMAKSYVKKPAPPRTGGVAIAKPALISAEYRQLNADLHERVMSYGVGGQKYAKVAIKLAEHFKTKNILDYGCGKGRLGMAIPWHIDEYDPAIPGKDEQPKPADIVICTDVLEHIEPDKLMFVLDDLRRCVLKTGYFVIHTQASSKSLADGRNAHLIQRPAAWWSKHLALFFSAQLLKTEGPLLHYVVVPKGS